MKDKTVLNKIKKLMSLYKDDFKESEMNHFNDTYHETSQISELLKVHGSGIVNDDLKLNISMLKWQESLMS